MTKQECLEIVLALTKFDMYLDGAMLKIQTNHQALVWLKNLKNPAGCLEPWSFLLAWYNYLTD